MLVVRRRKDEIAEKTESLLNKGAADKVRCQMAASLLRKMASLPRIRKEKVLAVRQRLADGTYDLDGGLDAVLDCLLADLATQGGIGDGRHDRQHEPISQKK